MKTKTCLIRQRWNGLQIAQYRSMHTPSIMVTCSETVIWAKNTVTAQPKSVRIIPNRLQVNNGMVMAHIIASVTARESANRLFVPLWRICRWRNTTTRSRLLGIPMTVNDDIITMKPTTSASMTRPILSMVSLHFKSETFSIVLVAKIFTEVDSGIALEQV